MKTDKEIIHDFVDISLQILQKLNLMKLPHPNMPAEMIDTTRKTNNDWIPWKAVPSNVTDNDIAEIESKIGVKLPEVYIEFLKYKHFYMLGNPKEISFYRHCVRDWKKDLLERYFQSWEPTRIIREGYIPFADYSDWGIVCFDTKIAASTENYEIVMIDHELLYSEPVPKQKLYPSFMDMMRELWEIQNKKLNRGA
jgi:hypothetical protein